MQVRAVQGWQRLEWIARRSAWMPAPPLESDIGWGWVWFVSWIGFWVWVRIVRGDDSGGGERELT